MLTGSSGFKYKSIIGKKPSKDKGKDTELMPDYDMTSENVSDNVLVFSDDSDDESEEWAKESEEEEEGDGADGRKSRKKKKRKMAQTCELTRNLAACLNTFNLLAIEYGEAGAAGLNDRTERRIDQDRGRGCGGTPGKRSDSQPGHAFTAQVKSMDP